MPRISVENLTKTYGHFRRFNALSGCSLTIDTPGLYSVVGPNGAGKTTLLKIIAGLIRPTGGSVTVQGSTFYVPENAAFYDNLTALEHFQLIEDSLGSHSTSMKPEDVLDLMGLPRERKVSGYSKGMKRRLDIGMSLVADRDIMLLDEPFEGLDPSFSEALSADLKRLNDGSRIIILSSHDLARVEDLSDVIIFLKRGSIVTTVERGKADRVTIKVPGGPNVEDFLGSLGVQYEVRGDGIIVTAGRERSQDLLRQLIAKGIEVEEMKSPSLLETYRRIMEGER
ncbi:ABC transporter [Thermogymnomonas acidicola]|uniref:ABC transporter n=1 Tax=Thermogymnomonas acidicola TaxID=399579 RepID=A0AA37BRX2_9ARCH|nr:ABC transporter ATP-binding protein [Thermogymnomonas acidicola]GGM74017.1 ABC transporter [Thermogymnomonas acidicola]